MFSDQSCISEAVFRAPRKVLYENSNKNCGENNIVDKVENENNISDDISLLREKSCIGDGRAE